MNMYSWWRYAGVGGIASVVMFSGCATSGGGSYWSRMSPSNWFASKSPSIAPNTPQLAAPPSALGSQARLGSAAPKSNSWFAGMTAPFKSSEAPASSGEDDPLSLNNKPKSVSPQLYVHLARLYETKGDFPAAIQQYEKARQIAPNDSEIMLGLARAYDRSGSTAQAEAVYKEVIKAQPQNAKAFNDLGLFYGRQHQNDLAVAQLQTAVQLAGDSQLYRNNLATVFVQTGRYDDAFQQLVAVHEPAAAHYNLGTLIYRKGDHVAARQQFEIAVQLDPRMEPARQMMSRLQAVAGSVPTPEGISQQVQQSTSQISAGLQDQLRDAEAKIRSAASKEAANIEQRYSSGWPAMNPPEPEAAPTKPKGNDDNPFAPLPPVDSGSKSDASGKTDITPLPPFTP